ncbi:OmpA family protein [Oleiagrimonas sp.]|jgi:peptidoglycan-associated lipoprotein|uniref:OmpA family protein n=1 Tax=Oleiagrimonas sp. TaxID=2010330 RepID=UPI0026111074|nr:OmpA family protein [Oleiagrimonas sp.]MDA3913771.1 OmpA family protein [Oleiagrimonas sp.]
MLTNTSKGLLLSVAMSALVLGGCSDYVKKSDLNAAVQQLPAFQQLQSKDQNLQQQITSLKSDMQAKLAKYDARITAMQGRIKVGNVAHFAFDKSTLQDSDKAMLDDFAKVMNAHHANAVVTVEGFTDPAGSAAFNKKLGMQRAEAVRNYLVQTDGMNADKVRAVSYGEAHNRQVQPGKWGPAGSENRHVSLVIDYAGS